MEIKPSVSNLNPRDKIYIIAVCVIFLGLFAWCPVNYILNEAGVLKSEDIKNYKDPEKVYESGVFSGVLNKFEEGKAAVENLYTNYMPMYGQIVTFLKSTDSGMQMSFIDLLAGDSESAAKLQETEEESIIISTEFSTIMLVDDGLHRYYAIRPFDFIDTALSLPEETLQANMEKQIGHINRISAAAVASNANFYLYIGKRMQDAEYFTEILPYEITTAPYLKEFMDRIENTKGKTSLNVDTLEKRLDNIFKTDHHWSALGVYSGYCDVINMIRKISPEIKEPVSLNGTITYEGVQMKGSASRISSFSRFSEPFSVMDIDIDLPAHQQYNAAKYANSEFDKSMYADHYELYYNDNMREYIYPLNNTGRKLLIIGDSFSWASAWLIASNFDETYVFYPWDRRKLDFNEYIEEKGITDVLYMQFSDRIMFNIYNDCPLENIVTR